MDLQLKRLLVFTCIYLLGLLSVSYSQSSKGYWQLVDVEIDEWDNILENRRTYLSGEPGNITYNTELGTGNNIRYFRATGQYDIPPKSLIPNQEYNITYSLEVIGYKSPQHGWNPGTHMNIWDYRPYKKGEKPRGRERYFVGVVSAMEKDESHKGTIKIVPPEYDGTDKKYFNIRFYIGSARPGAGAYYNYIYEWRNAE